MFWDPTPEVSLQNLIGVNKIARELGLFKDNYRYKTVTTTIQNEDEAEDTTNESEAPVFTGNKVFFPNKRRPNCENSIASLIDGSTILSQMVVQVPASNHVSSQVDEVTSHDDNYNQPQSSSSSSANFFRTQNEGDDNEDEDEENEKVERCKCGDRNCKLTGYASNINFKPCSNSTLNEVYVCKSGVTIFKNCRNKLCRSCYFRQMFKNERKK